MMNNKIKYIFLFLLFISSFIIRIWPLQEAHWWDETSYLQNAKYIFKEAEGYNELNFRPPLISILFGFGFLIWDNVFIASLIVSLISTIGNLYVYFIGKELYNEEIGILSSIIFAFSPFLVSNSRYLLTDVPSLSLIIIYFYYLIIAKKTNKKLFYFLSGIFLGLAILMRFTSLILLFIVPIYFIFHKINYKSILPFGLGSTIILLPYFIWAQITQGFFLKPFVTAKKMVLDSNESYFFYFSNFTNAFSILILVGFIIWLVFSILNIKINFKNSKKELFFTLKIKLNNFLKKDDLILFIWFIFFIGYITYIPHKELRYIIPISLPVILLASKGIYKIFLIKKKIKFFLLSLLFLLFIISSYPSFSRLSEPFINTFKTNEIIASQYLTNNFPKNTTIYTNHNYPVFAYYTGFKVIKIKQDSSFYENFQNEMKNNGLLIVYNNTKKEPKINWLNNNSKFKYLKNFNDIYIYEYKTK